MKRYFGITVLTDFCPALLELGCNQQLQPNTRAAEDRRLLIAIASGNKLAFSELYDRYAPMLFGLITAMIPDRPLAEEILQRIFVEVWQKAKALNDQTESISEWLWQRCRVLCMVSYNQNIQAIAGK
jgi:hypothetical protein